MKILQIGTNRGNDDLTQIIGVNEIEKFVIVEPMAIHNEDIEKCYSHVKNKIIENIAVSDSYNGSIDFFYHLNDGPGYEVSSTDINHVLKHGYNSDGIVKITVPSVNINTLMTKHGIKNLDILFIDAEGLDDVIVRSIDFDRFKIDKIYFENLHLKSDTHGFLKSVGYDVVSGIGLNGWTSLAQRI